MGTSLYTQQHRLFTVTTPLGQDQLLFHSLQGEEYLSALFHFRLELHSESNALPLENLVGKPVTVTVAYTLSSQERYFNGIVTRLEQAGTFTHPGGTARFTVYHVDLRPWLWQLTLTKNCRIFQNLSVPDILKRVFDDLGFRDYRDALIHSYPPRVYCVQYAETAFEFVSRLMEDEGIFYFFEHTAAKHVLVLADDLGVHKPCPGISTVRFLTVTHTDEQPEDAITEGHLVQQLTTSQYTVDDFNFETPSSNLETSLTDSGSQMRVYEYAAGFAQSTQGEKTVRTRLESHTANVKLLEGAGHCFSLTAGYQVTITEHPREDLNQTYVLRKVSHALSFERYSNSFIAHPQDTAYRPPVTTTKPQIVGTQTAIVVGPAGEEIYTDNYGRIKVQFHWDQEGQYNENSSCWIRVNQGWAGKSWGSLWLPRIGQEVIVSFLNGNPDTPIVTGAVYNAEQTVPYPLPGEQTKSTVKSNSSKGGGGFNEIRFEDKKGQEEVYFQAEKDWNLLTKNDKNQTVGHDETLKVGNNRTKTVGVNQSESIGANKTIQVGVNHSEQIGGNMTLMVGQNKAETVAIASAETVGAAKALTVGAAYQVSVGAAMNTTVALSQSEQVGKVKTVMVGDKIILQCGQGKITIEKSGKITIEGTEFLFNASGDVKINGRVVDIN